VRLASHANGMKKVRPDQARCLCYGSMGAAAYHSHYNCLYSAILIMAILASQADSVRLDSAHHLFNMVLAVMAPFIVGNLRCSKCSVMAQSLSSVKSRMLILD